MVSNLHPNFLEYWNIVFQYCVLISFALCVFFFCRRFSFQRAIARKRPVGVHAIFGRRGLRRRPDCSVVPAASVVESAVRVLLSVAADVRRRPAYGVLQCLGDLQFDLPALEARFVAPPDVVVHEPLGEEGRHVGKRDVGQQDRRQDDLQACRPRDDRDTVKAECDERSEVRPQLGEIWVHKPMGPQRHGECHDEKDEIEVQKLLEKAPYTNLPEEIKEELVDCIDCGLKLSELIVALDKDSEEIQLLLTDYRFDEASRIAGTNHEQLEDANRELSHTHHLVLNSGIVFSIDTQPPNNEVVQAYNEVLQSIGRLQNMLDGYQEILDSIKVLKASAEASLRPVNISFWIAPKAAYVGKSIRFGGVLSSEGIALNERKIQLLINGNPYMTVITGMGGQYRGDLVVPYEYTREIEVQALYSSEGDDSGHYISSQSQVLKLIPLSYQSVIELDVAKRAYSGCDTLDRWNGKKINTDGL